MNSVVDFKYILVNDKDKTFGLSVNTVGYQSIQPFQPYPVSDHPSGYFFNAKKGRVLREYQFVYLTQGKGNLQFENKHEIAVSKGVLFAIFPEQWHSYHPLPETGWNEYYIGFEGAFIDQAVEKGFLTNDKQIFQIGINEELINLFTRAIEIAESDKAASQQYLSGIVMHILGLILSVSQNKIFEESDLAQKIEQAKMIMNANILGQINAEDMAEQLNISYSWFRKVFREYTGYAPAKYFQLLKLRKAKQMLVGTSHSVKEIAFMLGYSSAEHFFSLFKKYAGYTPMEYRSYGREINP
ncbi:MAG: AraC family transcriptional regulator [Paludibacter sp.]|jgi:AraC-like DNA-binding protein|nr:AraC family transcriptional regulator [Paludibacter sp.]